MVINYKKTVHANLHLLLLCASFLFSCQPNNNTSSADISTDTSITPTADYIDTATNLANTIEFKFNDFVEKQKHLSYYQCRLLAFSTNKNAAVVVDQYYEDGACDGASYHVKLISLNAPENKLVYKLPCDVHNHYDTFFEQKDSLMNVFAIYNMEPVYDSVIILTREELVEKFNVHESSSNTTDESGYSYISNYKITYNNTIILNNIYNITERKILRIEITGGVYLPIAKKLLIRYDEKQEWDIGDVEGFSNFNYILIGI